MSAILPRPVSDNASDPPLLSQWWPVLAGLAALYLPSYITLVNTRLDGDYNIYCLIILAVVVWLVWRKRHALFAPAHSAHPLAGTLLFLFGLLLYVFGRSLGILILEAGSQIPVVTGLLLIFYGRHAVRKLWFPIFFLMFMLPLPGFVITGLTGMLKENVSMLVEQILYATGFPVARDGVMLTIGPYQLLVANACSGLNSMFSLSAMGILYVHLVRHPHRLRNITLLSAILPVAFVANIVRVVALLLITYYLGNDAGQGFLHGFASVVLFVTALLILFGLDSMLAMLTRHKTAGATTQ